MKTKISERFIEIINVLQKSKEPLTAQEIADRSKQEMNISTGKVYHCAHEGWIEAIPIGKSNKKAYTLSNSGEDVVKNPQNYECTSYTARPYLSKDKKAIKAKKVEQLEPEPKHLNVSVTTDLLMDNISTVIKENANYRETMLKTVDIMAKHLGLYVLTQDQYQALTEKE